MSDDDKILVVVKANYNDNIPKPRACRIANIFLKKAMFIILCCPSGAVL